MFTGIPVLGWAKPTPVDPRNFSNPVRDDILTSVVGPISNFVVVCAAVFALAAIAFTSQLGRAIVHFIPVVYPSHLEALAGQTNSLLMPLCLFIYDLMVINIVLGVFNLIPVPPLDGSHVLRHFLPDPVRRAYDMMGWIGLLILVYFGGGLLGRLIFPVIGVFDRILIKL